MDAIKRYSAMIAAFKVFPATEEEQARKVLEAARILGFSESLEVRKAFSVLRAFLEKLEEWEREHAVS